MKKKVLIVGMLDSIHLARWISQFIGGEVDIQVFPSRRFRRIHPQLKTLIENGNISLAHSIPKRLIRYMGYIDFLLESGLGRILKKSRSNQLSRVLNSKSFDYLHLIEFQHAGYLYLDVKSTVSKKWKTILTNLGSDIYFFSKFPEHEKKIRELLGCVDAYSAECNRDYKLAREFDFKGLELPLVPNAGGFSDEIFNASRIPITERREIFLKGYGGSFGLPDLVLNTCKKVLENHPEFKITLVSVTPDLLSQVKLMKQSYPNRLDYWTVKKPISHLKVLEKLGQSLIYFGFSKSDGISTTFLEALIMGAYPIQTNTSCADEWIEKGFIASSVENNSEVISSLLDSILKDRERLSESADANFVLAKKMLNAGSIRESSKLFYV
jgi:hypothetical protein